MVKIASILAGDCHLLATVHDELIYDVPADVAPQRFGLLIIACGRENKKARAIAAARSVARNMPIA
jgi:hypothetical protein